MTEREARAKANIWLAYYLGDAVGALDGVLVERGQQAIWQFEAFVTGANFKPIGPIGQVEVEANTGQVLNSPGSIEAMMVRGRELVSVP